VKLERTKGRHRITLNESFIAVLKLLLENKQLAEKYKDHALTGDWSDHRDCHIKPDFDRNTQMSDIV